VSKQHQASLCAHCLLDLLRKRCMSKQPIIKSQPYIASILTCAATMVIALHCVGLTLSSIIQNITRTTVTNCTVGTKGTPVCTLLSS
jgi:hypothetical protein